MSSYGTPPNRKKKNQYRVTTSADQMERQMVFNPQKAGLEQAGGRPITYGDWLGMLAAYGKTNASMNPTGTPPAAAPAAPGSPGSPGSRGPGGAGSGGSGGGSGSDPASNAIRTLYQMMNAPADPTALTNLDRIAGEAQTAGDSATAQLRSLLQQQQNPYTGSNVPAPQAAVNPLAAYMQAQGVAPSSVDAVRELINSDNAAMAGADERNRTLMRESWDRAQQSRMSDVGVSETAFRQALANQLAGGKTALEQQRQKRRDELMSQILQMAVQNGVDLSKLGVTF